VAFNIEFLFQVFEPFGQVELVQLPVDPLTGLCKGFGFIQASIYVFPWCFSVRYICLERLPQLLIFYLYMQFARLEDAKAAQSLNGQLDIAGRVIKVTLVDMYYVASKIVVNF
jgi:RNA-binding protein 39